MYIGMQSRFWKIQYNNPCWPKCELLKNKTSEYLQNLIFLIDAFRVNPSPRNFNWLTSPSLPPTSTTPHAGFAGVSWEGFFTIFLWNWLIFFPTLPPLYFERLLDFASYGNKRCSSLLRNFFDFALSRWLDFEYYIFSFLMLVIQTVLWYLFLWNVSVIWYGAIRLHNFCEK